LASATMTAAAEGVTAALGQEAVTALAASEPAWLQERRAHAWSVYEATPMPTTKLEEWRYTDLRKKLDLASLRLPDAERAPDDPKAWPARLRATMEEDHEASGHIVVIDGHVVHSDLAPELAEQGVILGSLHDAVQEHGALLEEHLAADAVPPEEGKFAALNAALWADGIFLYVPRGVRLELPVRVTRWLSEAGAAYFSRVLILAEGQSQVSYVDEVLSDDFEKQTLTSTAVEVVARDGAQVQYVAVQRLGSGAFYQSVQRTSRATARRCSTSRCSASARARSTSRCSARSPAATPRSTR